MPLKDPGAYRRARLAAARLYLVCPPTTATPGRESRGADRANGRIGAGVDRSSPGARDQVDLLRAAIAGGVDVVQLREKNLPDEQLLALATDLRVQCERLGALFIVNDRPLVALRADADGVHVGQDDMPVTEARKLLGPDMLIGLSTHAPEEIDAEDAALADYIGVGPVHETPTKPGRPAVGLELVRYAAAHASRPFFAIGGLHAGNLGEAIEAGARRAVVLRAIADAEDPQRAAHTLRDLLKAHPLEP